MARQHVETVVGKHLAIAVLMTSAGVEAGIGQLQMLNQQPSPHVDGVRVIDLG